MNELYNCVSDIVIINNNKKLILSFYNTKSVLVSRKYATYIGAYSIEMNYWIWGNESDVIDKYFKKQIEEYRKKIYLIDNEEVKKFSKNNTMVIPNNELNDLFKMIDNNIYINKLSTKLDVYVIDKTLYSSVSV